MGSFALVLSKPTRPSVEHYPFASSHSFDEMLQLARSINDEIKPDVRWYIVAYVPNSPLNTVVLAEKRMVSNAH